MEYNKTADGKYEPLEQKNVDTGLGLERVIALMQGVPTHYDTELFMPVMGWLSEKAGIDYSELSDWFMSVATPSSKSNDGVQTTRIFNTNPTPDYKNMPGHFVADFACNYNYIRSMRIIADHIRAAVFIIGDPKGVMPSNTDQGYVLRRLIRRAIRQMRKIGIDDSVCDVAKIFIDIYPELSDFADHILTALEKEEAQFCKTLNQGEREFEKILPNLLRGDAKILSGRLAFKLYDTYGFPLEMTKDLAKENGLTVDEDGFNQAFEKHQELSRAGAEAKFKGGLQDHSEATTALHTATHLLLAALRQVLGDHVFQKGSNITAERLRFDFSHPEAMTEEQKNEVERLVNEWIEADLEVGCEEMTPDEAHKCGAVGVFGERYGDIIKVYTVKGASKEICGGPHVEKTGGMGKFHIKKEQSSSSGVRRIKAVLE